MAATVRRAGPGEVERVLGMYEWLFSPPGSLPPAWDPERARDALAEAISGEDSAVLVAEHRSELVGLATAYLDLDSVRFGLRCWVEDLAVSPEHRSRGIGKALLDAAKDWARARGATHLELDSGVARGDAHRFYERERPSWESKHYSWQL
ncbi:MAG: GNAT family N-acetyltransferase [Actinomycetota bacterium]|nr:GNAT family N-acetyltransferase [Actinomycetota bacterium]